MIEFYVGGPKLDCSKLRIKPEQQLLDFYGGRMMNFFSKNVSDKHSAQFKMFNHLIFNPCMHGYTTGMYIGIVSLTYN